MNRSRLTRLLHLLLAATVVFQLLASLVMEHPEEDDDEHAAWILERLVPAALAHEDEDEARAPEGSLPALLFEAHELVGLSAVVVVLAFWGWIAVRRNEPGLGEMLPWFSATRRQALGEDFRRHWDALKSGHLPQYQPHSPFVNAIHGLGLLTATGMALTGLTWWLGEDLGLLGGLGEAAEEIHELLSNLMWAYLIGHAGLAVIHQLKGEPIVREMFSLGGGSSRDDR